MGSSAETQMNIVGYLSGKTVQRRNLISLLDLGHKFGFEKNFHSKLDHLSSILKEEFECTFKSNGFDLSICKGCPHFSIKAESHIEPVTDKVFSSCTASCSRNGCNHARRHFVENMEKMEKMGKCLIDLEVELDSRVKKSYMTKFDGEVERVEVMEAEKEFSLKAAPKLARFEPSDFFSTGEIKTYKKQPPKAVKERSLEEQVDILLREEGNQYDVDVW